MVSTPGFEHKEDTIKHSNKQYSEFNEIQVDTTGLQTRNKRKKWGDNEGRQKRNITNYKTNLRFCAI